MSSTQHVVYRLHPPRPTFPADMTDTEAATMRAHIEYWSDLLDRGTAVVFGPVADPTGEWGLAVAEVVDAEHADRIRQDDPVTRAGLATIEMYPMRAAFARPLPH